MVRLWQWGNEQSGILPRTWEGPVGVGWTGYFPLNPYSGIKVRLTQDFSVDGLNSLEIIVPPVPQYPYGGPHRIIDEENYNSYPVLHYRFYFTLPVRIPVSSDIGRFAWISTVPTSPVDGSPGPFEEGGITRNAHSLISMVYGRDADGKDYFLLESWKNDVKYIVSDIYYLDPELAPYEPLCVELAYDQNARKGYLYLDGKPQPVASVDVAPDGWTIDPNSTGNPPAGRVSHFVMIATDDISRVSWYIDAVAADTEYIGLIPQVQRYTLTIFSGNGGTTDPPAGEYIHEADYYTTVSAIASKGYRFDHWEYDEGTFDENPIQVLMNVNHTLTPVFIESDKQILTINSAEGGTTNPPAGAHEYDKNSYAMVTAIPGNGYLFVHFIFDGFPHADNPLMIWMNTAHEVTPVFEEIGKPVLTLSTIPVEIELTLDGKLVPPGEYELEVGDHRVIAPVNVEV